MTGPERDGTRQLGAPLGSLEDVIPEPYLTGVGCTSQTGPRDSSTVAVKRFGGGFARFSCAAVNADSIKAAIARYRTAGAAALGGASAQSGDPGNEGGEGGLVYLYTTYSCDLTHVWEYDPVVGMYYYLWTTGECVYREHYWDPSSGSPPQTPAPSDSLLPHPNPPTTCVSPSDTLSVEGASTETFFALWDEPEPASIKVCRSAACMDSLPGVWVGAWPISTINGWKSHAAILTTPPRQVDELLGWDEFLLNHFNSSDAPYYSGFAGYKWVRVGGTAAIPAVRAAVTRAQGEFAYSWYSLGSNRFISNILKDSNHTFSDEQYHILGKPWGICRCGGVCVS